MRCFSLFLVLVLAGFAVAQDEYPEGQCAQGTRCDSYYSDGVCRDWAPYQVCGLYCAQGRVCDNRYSDGTCREWALVAACGNQSCVSGPVCDSRYSDGLCRDWAVVAKCQ